MLTHAMVLALAAATPIRGVLAHDPPRPETRVALSGRPAAYVAVAQPTPDPAPTVVPAPPPPAPPAAPLPAAPAVADESIAGIIRAAAQQYGADPDQLVRVANCESHLNPQAYNARTGVTGLFQFLPSVFFAHGGHNIWDAHDQSAVAARMFAAGWAYQWSCR
jgi:hypothetical protein